MSGYPANQLIGCILKVLEFNGTAETFFLHPTPENEETVLIQIEQLPAAIKRFGQLERALREERKAAGS